MANNLVVQLLLKTGTFSTDLKTARGQVQQFQQGCQNAGRSLDAFGRGIGVNIGALTKMGGAIGAAALAGKEFKAIIDSTQTSADTFEGVIAGCTGVLESFNTSIAKADFSTFTNGLWSVYDAAVNARNAIDALQDAQLGYGMISSDNNAAFATAQNNYREARESAKNTKTKEEREKFEADAERYRKEMADILAKEEEASRNFQYKNMNAIKATLHARNTDINEKDVTEAAIMRAAEIFNSANDEAERKAAKERAKTIMKSANQYKDKAKRSQYLNDYGRQFDLIVAELLELPNKKIEAVAAELQAGKNARRSAESMRRSYDRTTRTGSTPTTTTRTTTTKTQKEELEIMENSLTYWKNILAEETKYRDALVKDTDEWKIHNDNVIKAQNAIKNIEGEIKKSKEYLEGSVSYYKDMIAEATRLRDQNVYLSDEWFEQDEKVKQLTSDLKDLEHAMDLHEYTLVDPPTLDSLNNLLSVFTALRNEAAIGSIQFETWGEMIKYVKKQIDEANGVNINAPKTDGWDSFNKSMSSTATIVNSLASTFQDGMKVTAASILKMVSTALPAVGSLISALATLAGVEATEKAVQTSKHWIEAIAAVAALGAAVATAISASKRGGKYANGGIVPGNSFTGDRVTAQVNSGEMILNKAQQARLFKIANGQGGGGQVEFHISGTELVGVLNNQNRKNRLIQ